MNKIFASFQPLIRSDFEFIYAAPNSSKNISNHFNSFQNNTLLREQCNSKNDNSRKKSQIKEIQCKEINYSKEQNQEAKNSRLSNKAEKLSLKDSKIVDLEASKINDKKNIQKEILEVMKFPEDEKTNHMIYFEHYFEDIFNNLVFSQEATRYFKLRSQMENHWLKTLKDFNKKIQGILVRKDILAVKQKIQQLNNQICVRISHTKIIIPYNVCYEYINNKIYSLLINDQNLIIHDLLVI